LILTILDELASQTLIRQFLELISYPFYFFDFETIMSGVPEFDDIKPYQQIPFQYSLHVQRQEDSELEHFEYLGDRLNDPRSELLEALIEDLGVPNSIICYNLFSSLWFFPFVSLCFSSSFIKNLHLFK
jgi:hypothetical protein